MEIVSQKIQRIVSQSKAKIDGFSDRIAPGVNIAVDRINTILGKPVVPLKQIALLLAIKYLYIFLIVMILKDQWYIGYGSYGIDFKFWKEILGTIAFVAVSFIYMTTKIKDRFIDSVMYFLLVLYYIPLNSAFAINNQPFLFFLSSNMYFLLLVVAVSFSEKHFQKYKVKNRHKISTVHETSLIHDRNVAIVCAVACCLFLVYKFCYNGFSFSLSIVNDELYNNRAENTAFLDTISGTLLSYLLAIVRYSAGFLIPFYTLISMLKKKWRQALFGLIGILAQFSVSAQKASLLSVFIIAFLYICYRLKLLKHFKRIFEFGMIALMVVCVLEHYILQSDRFFTLLVRRMMYYPAWLNTMYYDFFMNNGPMLWTESVFLLQNLLKPVYDATPIVLISEAYFDGAIPSPNTGLFAEAIMHANLAGVIIYPVLLAAYLQVSGWIYKKYGVCVQIFLAINLTLQLQNVPILRTDSVLSYWFCTFLLLVLPYLYPHKLKAVVQTFFYEKE